LPRIFSSSRFSTGWTKGDERAAREEGRGGNGHGCSAIFQRHVARGPTGGQIDVRRGPAWGKARTLHGRPRRSRAGGPGSRHKQEVTGEGTGFRYVLRQLWLPLDFASRHPDLPSLAPRRRAATPFSGRRFRQVRLPTPKRACEGVPPVSSPRPGRFARVVSLAADDQLPRCPGEKSAARAAPLLRAAGGCARSTRPVTRSALHGEGRDGSRRRAFSTAPQARDRRLRLRTVVRGPGHRGASRRPGRSRQKKLGGARSRMASSTAGEHRRHRTFCRAVSRLARARQ